MTEVTRAEMLEVCRKLNIPPLRMNGPVEWWEVERIHHLLRTDLDETRRSMEMLAIVLIVIVVLLGASWVIWFLS